MVKLCQKLTVLLILLIMYSGVSYSQINSVNTLSGPYFGQIPPGTTPEIFAQGTITTNLTCHGSPIFSPNGNEVYWTIIEGDLYKTLSSKIVDGFWTAPAVDPLFQGEDYNPFLSTDGSKIYFKSQRYYQVGGYTLYGMWVSEKVNDNWSSPVPVGAPFSSGSQSAQGSITDDGTIYFALNNYYSGKGKHDIYRSKLVNGNYTTPENLGDQINTSEDEWEPYIAPDESFMIFGIYARPDASGPGDLHISFRKIDGSWTESISMGDKINSDKTENFPTVSPDGKYLFFVSDRDNNDYHSKVYWVDTSIIEELKSGFSDLVTSIKDDQSKVADKYQLFRNYPNPFNPETTISFILPVVSDVTLKVYDLTGVHVKTLISGQVSAGSHNVKWDATNDLGQKVSSGVYLYVLNAGNYTKTKKTLLLK